jgi:hypothetical protein
MTGDQRSAAVNSLRRELVALLQARKDPEMKVIYTGTETLDGIACEMIAVMVGNDNVRFAVDPSTGRVLRATFQGKNMMGVPGEITAIFGGYGTVDGISLPFSSKRLFNGEPMWSFEIKEMTINGAIDEAGFKMPEGAAAGAPSGAR